MHQDVEKLLNAAKEKGFITEKQRDIILNKAQQLGEDMAEVEFMLEDITIKKGTNEKVKSKKCPNCGALIDDLALKCPECGAMISEEADASAKVRAIIKETSEKLSEITKSRKIIRKELKEDGMEDVDVIVEDEIAKRQVAVINAFSVPFTANALIQGYAYALGRSSLNKLTDDMEDTEEMITSAWLNKAKELYKLVQSVPNPDQQTQIWLENNKSILEAKHKGIMPNWLGILLGLVTCFLLYWGIYKLFF